MIVTFAGSDGQKLQFVAKTKAGVVINLTGHTLTMRAKLGSTVMMNAVACTVTTAASGEFEITPTAAQILTVGDYDAQVKCVVAGSPAVTFFLEAFTIRVMEAI
jgi:hypothetical protein